MNYPRAYHVLSLRLHPKQNISWIESAISSANHLNNKVIVAELSGVLGLCFSNLGEIRKAISYFNKALAVYVEIKDRENEGIGLATWEMPMPRWVTRPKLSSFMNKI